MHVRRMVCLAMEVALWKLTQRVLFQSLQINTNQIFTAEKVGLREMEALALPSSPVLQEVRLDQSSDLLPPTPGSFQKTSLDSEECSVFSRSSSEEPSAHASMWSLLHPCLRSRQHMLLCGLFYTLVNMLALLRGKKQTGIYCHHYSHYLVRPSERTLVA